LGERIADGGITGLDEDFGVAFQPGLVGDFIEDERIADAVVGDDVDVGLYAWRERLDAQVACGDLGGLEVPVFFVANEDFGNLLLVGQDQEGGPQDAGVNGDSAFERDFDGAGFGGDGRRFWGCGFGGRKNSLPGGQK